MKYIFKSKRRILIFLFDILIIGCSYYAANLIRFGGTLAPKEFEIFITTLPVLVITKMGSFILFGLYSQMLRYASISALLNILKGVSVGTVITVVFVFMSRNRDYSRSVWIIDWLLSFFLIGGLRLTIRIFREFLLVTPDHAKRVLIVGAGDAGEMILREIKNNGRLGYHVVGFVDNEKKKIGMNIHDTPVLGSVCDIQNILTRKRVEEVIIAATAISGEEVKKIVDQCKAVNIECRTIPNISDLINGTISIKQIRDIQIEDLLGREPIRLDLMKIRSLIQGKVALITGGGGSIGSELCRQISKFEPDKMVIIDKAETALHEIMLTLQKGYSRNKLFPVLMDLRDSKNLESIFGLFSPDIIFHAAAYKHVPILEYFPYEAVTNNIIATKNLADIAVNAGVEAFVLISTDKVVRPTNIMGASKRICEMYIQELSNKFKTKFVTVRFGNVLESNGSVVPLFKRQIIEGGPLTVTHPEVKRYFMTISEAVQLILEASSLGEGGEIFVLDMGKPIKIVDLAKNLISLSCSYHKDNIKIVFTGLRPGEKLFEELYTDEDKMLPTQHEKIKIFRTNCHLNGNALNTAISELNRFAEEGNNKGIINKFQEMVTDYQPSETVVNLSCNSSAYHRDTGDVKKAMKSSEQ